MKFLFLLIILLCNISIYGQRNVDKEAIGTPWIGIQYGLNVPQFDLRDRFGLLNHLGVLAGYKTKRNWFFGVDANFIFGNQINETGLLSNLTDSYGNIADVNGDITEINLFARGFNTNLTLGKVIPVFSPNKNSGLFVHTGVGFLEHHIRIETNNQVSPQIELDYKKGYDKLVAGINFHQFIGYAFMANAGFINFYGGVYFQQGFTKNQRSIFYTDPTSPVSQAVRKDFNYGLKVGWLIPIYKRKPKEYYFN
jgi:hypothetical protein